jgi:DNA-binding response OmpR family regulator
VAAVHNGQDAYDYALSGGYDAIILNVMMPKMNGIEVLQRLRKEGVQVPIMMLTAKGQTDDRIAGFSRSR